MEHIFEEYGTNVDNKYVFIVCKPETSDTLSGGPECAQSGNFVSHRQKAINLCKEKLDEGFHVLSNELISHHPRFILVNNATNKPYYIYRIYT